MRYAVAIDWYDDGTKVTIALVYADDLLRTIKNALERPGASVQVRLYGGEPL